MKLEEIYHPISAELDRVENLLNSEMNRAVERGRGGANDKLTKRAISYLLSKPGKHLRPALVLFSSKALHGESNDSLIELAAAVELIHSASLVHDDIIDEAEKRRSLLSVHRKYGVKIAILVGDVLFAQAFSIVANLPGVPDAMKVRLFSILADLTKRMCYGEIFEQNVLKSVQKVSKEDYLRILEFKTALLMSVACRCGAILANAEEDKEERLAAFGLSFGFAYQLTDDHKDGDSIYGGKNDLINMARDHIEDIKIGLNGFGDEETVTSMVNLAEYILSARAAG